MDEIEAKNTIFNKDYVQIKQDDFDMLIYMAKNYVKDTEYLKSENIKLKTDIKRMIEKLNEKESLKEMSSKARMEIDINKLKEKVNILSDFIISKDLADEFNRSIEKSKNKNKGLEK